MGFGCDNGKQEWASRLWEKLERKLRAECLRLGDCMPYMAENGVYQDMGNIQLSAWTNGFYAGMLWQLYHAAGDECFMEAARKIEERLDPALASYEELDHDVGFLWLHTAVADYRLTGNEASRRRGLHAAGILAGRYHPAGRYIRAWNGDRQGIAIVDCLMNVPLLYWASGELGDKALFQIGEAHTETALHKILRPDGSSNHMADFDVETGELLSNPGGQGYGVGSSWSRGQAWAIYGMALAFRYTGRREFLDAAKRAAHYFCACVSLTDYIPLLDFRAPREPVYVDTTAGVCAACGLMELSEHVGELEKELYREHAYRLLRAAEAYCDWNPERDGILDGGSARYDRERDREKPLIYGDYFLTEGILRMQGRAALLW